ncbi:MAG: hypothetical protein M3O70_25965, partial [Actinomycetota bacterium]|nr:hypothetical protein [Actinomycetota bacterium]
MDDSSGRDRRVGWIHQIGRVPYRVACAITSALEWLRARIGRLGFVLVVVATALTLMGGFADTLAEMHIPGGIAYGPGDLTSLNALLRGEAPLSEVFGSWRRWEADFGSGTLPSPRKQLLLWLVVDTFFFAPGVALLLLHTRDAAVSSDDDTAAAVRTDPARRTTTREALAAATPVIGAYLLFDWFENALVAFAAWTQWSDAPSALLGMAIVASSVVKWLAILLVVAPTVAVWLSARIGRPPTERVPHWSVLLRAQLLAVGAYAALFVRVDQVDDVVLTWGSTESHAIAALAAGLVAAATVALTGRALLRDYERRVPPTRDIKPSRWILAGATGGMAIVLLFATVGASAEPSPLAATVIPAAVVLFGLLSIPGNIRHLVAHVPTDPDIRRKAVDDAANALRWLSAVPMAALALAAVRAIPPALFLEDRGRSVVLVPAAVASVCLGLVGVWALAAGRLSLRPPPPAVPLDIDTAVGWSEWTRRAAWGVAALGVAAVIWVSPLHAPQFLGSAALLGALGAIATLALSPFSRARLRPARGPLRILGFRYVPAFGLLLA